MTDFIYRSCSNCVYWSDKKYEFDEVIKALCENDINKFTQGSDKCGQWKKLKYRYESMWDEMRKDYK